MHAGCPTQRGFRCVGRWEVSPLSHSHVGSTTLNFPTQANTRAWSSNQDYGVDRANPLVRIPTSRKPRDVGHPRSGSAPIGIANI